MPYCPFEYPSDMTVEVFNYERQKHHNLIHKLAKGEVKLLCDKCEHPVHEETHEDHSRQPPMRQVTCPNCTWTGYRYL